MPDRPTPRDPLAPERVRPIVRTALAEDLDGADVTTEGILPEPAESVTGRIVAREAGVVCGLPVAEAVFTELDPDARLEPLVDEGAGVDSGADLARVSGTARAVLGGERVALNFLQRMAGVATETRRYVEAVEGTGTSVTDTRKTTPGLRLLERYAVRLGGGRNHRWGLPDQVLVKDNHWMLLRRADAGIAERVREVRRRWPELAIEVEVADEATLEATLEAEPDWILLDNHSPEEATRAVARIRDVAPAIRIEASGGIDRTTARAYAETGVDRISIGALTHSVEALDIALDLEEVSPGG